MVINDTKKFRKSYEEANFAKHVVIIETYRDENSRRLKIFLSYRSKEGVLKGKF